ncbi:MAG: ATP-binding protein [Phycisphaeraceae bacterium]|nr:ATP-binding protein [Phycisphaerales bacterium]MCB9859712.1 ATP-binding protein [Phycisphaeraceae bacterium]
MDSTTWQPTSEDNLAALVQQNPWHQLENVPRSLAFTFPRSLSKLLWQTLQQPLGRYQVIIGPRRVGKTVTMYQTIQSLIEAGVHPQRLWFLNLDHPLLMNYELDAWVRAITKRFGADESRPLYLFLDEVSMSHNWDRWLKVFYDERRPIRVVATSSSTAALRGRTVESGIGRWTEQYLTPYSFSEYLQLREHELPSFEVGSNLLDTLRSCAASQPLFNVIHHRIMYLLVGGFPELLLREHNTESMETAMLRSQQTLRQEAVQRVATMDIPQVFDIKHPFLLERLVYVLGGQMCGIMNMTNLASLLSLHRHTVAQYVSYLEQAFLIFTLPNYAHSEEAVQRRGQKVYFVDGAVRNAALQRGIAPVSDAREQGFLTENAAVSHLQSLSLQTGVRTYHWRDNGREVDVIYDDPSGPLAFEITTSSNHTLKGIHALCEKYPQFQKRCFIVSSESSSLNMPEDDPNGVGRIPFDLFMITIGRQAEYAMTQRLGMFIP